MAPKPPTPAQIEALKKSKGVKPTATIKSVSDSKVAQMKKDTVKAKTKDMIDPKRGLNQAKNIIIGAVLLGGAVGAAAKSASARAAAEATAKALAKSKPTTSKTMNVPKGTKVITSNKSGMAKATPNVGKVTVQKSPSRVAAGIKSNATRQGAAAANLSRTTSNATAKGGVAGATIVQGIRCMDKKKKK